MDFTLAGKGDSEWFKQDNDRVRLTLERPERLQVGAVGLEGFEWRLEGLFGGL